jgi:hypothetical protein
MPEAAVVIVLLSVVTAVVRKEVKIFLELLTLAAAVEAIMDQRPAVLQTAAVQA